MVETEPPSLGIERNEKEIGVLQIAEDSGGLVLRSDVITKRRGESIDDRHVEDEFAYVIRLLVEYLLSEVITNKAIVAAKMAYKFAGIWAASQRKHRQIESGGPSLGSMHEF